jgi:hypothetical protein
VNLTVPIQSTERNTSAREERDLRALLALIVEGAALRNQPLPGGVEGDPVPPRSDLEACLGRAALRPPVPPAWPEERVFQYIRAQRGGYFDPAVVDAALGLLTKEP